MPYNLDSRLPYLQLAIELAVQNVTRGGGPFGAVVVRNGEVVATGVNRVTATHDPTAHAEVVAIRAACSALGSFQLDGCEVYCSCEPCPMCLGALYWARPSAVVFAATAADAAAAGFDDAFIYEELARSPTERELRMVRLDAPAAGEPFARWRDTLNRVDY